MTLERNLWSWLSGARRELGAALDINRVENGVMAGMPDVEGFLNMPDPGGKLRPSIVGQFWLELKSKERPARGLTPIRFDLRKREAQIEWMRNRWNLGGNVFWLLQVGSGHERVLYLARGDFGDKLKAGVTEGELLAEVCQYGFLGDKKSPGEVIKWVVQCRTKSFRIGL